MRFTSWGFLILLPFQQKIDACLDCFGFCDAGLNIGPHGPPKALPPNYISSSGLVRCHYRRLVGGFGFLFCNKVFVEAQMPNIRVERDILLRSCRGSFRVYVCCLWKRAVTYKYWKETFFLTVSCSPGWPLAHCSRGRSWTPYPPECCVWEGECRYAPTRLQFFLFLFVGEAGQDYSVDWGSLESAKC